MPEPTLRGLAVLYAAALSWSALFALWFFALALLFRRTEMVVRLFLGPRLRFGPRSGPTFALGLLPAPVSSASEALPAWEGSVAETDPPDEEGEGEEGEDRGEAIPPEDENSEEEVPTVVPFSDRPLATRVLVALGPYAVLAAVVVATNGAGALTRLPTDVGRLLTGAASPLGAGSEMARAFLTHLGRAPLTEAATRALAKVLASTLLPVWGGVPSALVMGAFPSFTGGKLGGRVVVGGTLLALAFMGSWIVAILKATLT